MATIPEKKSNAILKQALVERCVNQIELANRMGMIQSSVSGNINRQKIGLDVFTRMLDVLDYDVVVVDRHTGEALWKVRKEEKE